MRGNRILKWADYWLGIPLCAFLGWRARMSESLSGAEGHDAAPTEVRNILIIKFSAVGDTVLVWPALRAIRERYPAARIVWLASPINEGAARVCQDVDEVRVFDPAALSHWLRILPQQRFDLVIDFDQWSRLTALLTIFSGAPVRIGFDTKGQGRGLAYNRAYAPPAQAHEQQNFLALARLAGVKSGPFSAKIKLPSSAHLLAERLVNAAPHPRVAIHPGCGRVGKPREWEPKRFASVADWAVEKYGASVFITGGRDDGDAPQQVAKAMNDPATLLCSNYSFVEFAALLGQMDVLVCGNTGAMHIAAAMGVKTVALHGPTNPRRWGPVGEGHAVIQSPLPCSPCLDLGFEYGCRTHPCMKTISTDEVIEALDRILKHFPEPTPRERLSRAVAALAV